MVLFVFENVVFRNDYICFIVFENVVSCFRNDFICFWKCFRNDFICLSSC